MFPYLVADIGGTNARFALITGKSASGFNIEHIQILSTKNHTTLSDALNTYLSGLDGIKPKAMCLAVAGPVVGDTVKLTNLSWEFSCSAMATEFGVEKFLAMNDFAAVAAACGQLNEDHLVCIKPGEEKSQFTKAVFGPGTGLGVAGLVNYNNLWLPVPCEGGHVNLAPSNDFEAEVIKAGMSQLGHVSAENFISGPGLVKLYKAICQVQSVQAENLQPADITKGALENSQGVLFDTLSTFCSIAGAFAGNLALTYGAQGGVYIAGGVFPRFVDFLKASEFNQRFSNKGVMSHYVENIPVHLIQHTETAFVGAAAWLDQNLNN